MSEIVNQSVSTPQAILEMLVYLKSKIKASKEQAKEKFLNFANQMALKSSPDLRSMLNRIRDELRSVNPQQALAIHNDPMAQMKLPFTARITAGRNDLG